MLLSFLVIGSFSIHVLETRKSDKYKMWILATVTALAEKMELGFFFSIYNQVFNPCCHGNTLAAHILPTYIQRTITYFPKLPYKYIKYHLLLNFWASKQTYETRFVRTHWDIFTRRFTAMWASPAARGKLRGLVKRGNSDKINMGHAANKVLIINFHLIIFGFDKFTTNFCSRKLLCWYILYGCTYTIQSNLL